MVGVGYLGSGELSSRQGNVRVFTHRQLDDRSRGFRDVYRALPGSSCDGTKPGQQRISISGVRVLVWSADYRVGHVPQGSRIAICRCISAGKQKQCATCPRWLRTVWQ